MPLVVDRLGSSHRMALDRLRELLAAGQADGSIAPGDVEAMALQVMSMAAIHVFSARAYDSVDPRGRRWPELERALDGYLRPCPADRDARRTPMNRPAALPLRPSSASPRIEHLAPGDPSSLLTRDRRDRWRTSLEQGAAPGRARGRRRDHRRRCRPRRGVPRAAGGPGRARRPRSRDLALVQQARPRRPALPRLRPGRGRLGERPGARGPRRCRRPAPDPPAAPGGALLRRPRRAGSPTGPQWADRRGRPARRRPHAPRDAAAGPVAGPGAGHRAGPVAGRRQGAWGDGALGLPARGRRPPGRGRRPDGCRLRGGDPHPHRGPVDRSRARRCCATDSTARPTPCGRGTSSTPPAPGPRSSTRTCGWSPREAATSWSAPSGSATRARR